MHGIISLTDATSCDIIKSWIFIGFSFFFSGTASPATLSALLCGSEVGSLQDDFYLTGSLPSVDEESMTPEQRQEREELRAVSK